MKPLQVYLDEREQSALERWARSRGWTKSQAIRAAIRALTRPASTDPLLDASGMIDDLPADLSSRFDQYLEETFVAKTPARQKPRTRRAPHKRVRRQ
jgi:hypothetical protein